MRAKALADPGVDMGSFQSAAQSAAWLRRDEPMHPHCNYPARGERDKGRRHVDAFPDFGRGAAGEADHEEAPAEVRNHLGGRIAATLR